MDNILILIYVYTAIMGVVVGSFCNVCILRIPRGESVVTTPSHCFSCGGRLRFWELFPLVSWLALGGRCARCHAKISVQYPIIEAANGCLWILVFSVHGFTVDTILGCLLASALLVLSVIDGRTKEIPIQISVFIGILGAVRFAFHLEDWTWHLLGMVVISGLLMVILIASGGAAIGGGDVKLMAGSGLYLGLGGSVLGFIIGCTLGSIIHIIRMRFFGAERELAMGPYLAAGILIAMLWGTPIIDWYMGML